jgi:hypothetical protein
MRAKTEHEASDVPNFMFPPMMFDGHFVSLPSPVKEESSSFILSICTKMLCGQRRLQISQRALCQQMSTNDSLDRIAIMQ